MVQRINFGALWLQNHVRNLDDQGAYIRLVGTDALLGPYEDAFVGNPEHPQRFIGLGTIFTNRVDGGLEILQADNLAVRTASEAAKREGLYDAADEKATPLFALVGSPSSLNGDLLGRGARWKPRLEKTSGGEVWLSHMYSVFNTFRTWFDKEAPKDLQDAHDGTAGFNRLFGAPSVVNRKSAPTRTVRHQFLNALGFDDEAMTKTQSTRRAWLIDNNYSPALLHTAHEGLTNYFFEGQPVQMKARTHTPAP